MTLGARIEERRKALGLSQAELARRVGIRQSTMNSLINGSSRSSRSIVQIARELRTTPAFLTGETDDPGEEAAIPAPRASTVVMMPVVLPPEQALEAMFRGMIRSLPELAGDDLAHELAKLLPIAFQQVRGPLRFESLDEAVVVADTGQEPPGDNHERRRA